MELLLYLKIDSSLSPQNNNILVLFGCESHPMSCIENMCFPTTIRQAIFFFIITLVEICSQRTPKGKAV
jgi:hypothetical protein